MRTSSGGIPPTQLVDRSYSASKNDAYFFRGNPTNAVGGSFILSLKERRILLPGESHQRSWWIVHTQPQRTTHTSSGGIPPTQLVDRSYSAYKRRRILLPGIPPTQLMDRSYSAYKRRRVLLPGNPTNAVGRSFILSLKEPRILLPGIPPTQLMDRSYSAYKRRRVLLPGNP